MAFSRKSNAAKNSTSAAAIKAAADRAEKPKESEAVKSAKAIVNIRRGGTNPLAVELGKLIGPATITELENTVEADEYLQVNALLVSDLILKDFTPEQIARVPEVDTNKSAKENYQGNNPDYTVIKEGKRESRLSFFDTMLSTTAKGTAKKKEIADMEAVVGSKEGASADLKRQFINPPERKAHLARLRRQWAKMLAKYKQAWKVVQQKARLESECGEYITYAVTKDSKGNVIPGPLPIYLEATGVPKGTARPYDNFSVTSFLSLNVAEALEKREADTAMATWSALIDTLSKDEGDKEDPDNIAITNFKRFETGMASMLTFINENPEAVTKLIALINGAKDFSEVAGLAKTVGDLAGEFGQIKTHIQKRYTKAAMLESAADGTLHVDAKTLQELAS